MSLKKAFDRNGILIYPWYISDLVATREIRRVTKGPVISRIFYGVKNDLATLYYDQDSTDALGRRLLDKIIKDRKFYRLVIRQIYHYSDQLMSFCRHLDEVVPAELSDRQLLEIYAEYERRLSELRAWGWVPVILDGIFTPFLSDRLMADFRDFLAKHGQAAKLPEYYSLLSASDQMSEVQTETLERLRLLEKISRTGGQSSLLAIKNGTAAGFKKRFPAESALMDAHLQRFGWLTYAYTGPVMSFAYLFSVLRADLSKGQPAKQINNITRHFRTIKPQKRRLVQRIKLSPRLSYLFAVSSEFMFIKDYRKGIYQKSYVAMDKILSELAKRLGVSRRDIRNLTRAEVTEALLKGQAGVYRRRASQRTKFACYEIKAGRIKVYEGSRAKHRLAVAARGDKPVGQLAKQLSGSIAYAGRARGLAKIILTKADLPKMRPGDILVSSATNPDLIAAMEQAAAFVTDTGGIICHAAIVARELKKPCVIGTKVATKVIKDGDLIEVDANQGIVKIIKK
ncbi:MAG: PEP-utilizing enzyme [Patescibacteria group bacterium]